MYIPRPFEVSDQQELFNFIKNNSFGILFSRTERGLFATHLPFLLEERTNQGYLLAHMAKENPHWKELQREEVLVVFSGPHTYISPTWYGDKNTVPTWNYVAVHVYGECELIEDQDSLNSIMEKTVQFYESSLPNPWQADINDEFVKRLMKAIVGFRIRIARIEGKWKLSQNHSIERQQNVISSLRQ
ncbi:MAG: FMN-binding negative transcriptional regulator, partial [Thermicanus sp.]|nr:FMN-binding negative transcriptional regulator [Thermicanus sp.]